MCISLRFSTYVMGSNINLGLFGVTGVKRSLTKNTNSVTEYMALSPWCNIVYPCYSCTCISLRPSIAFMGSRSTWGHFCRQGTPAVPAMLSSFLFFFFHPDPFPGGGTQWKMVGTYVLRKWVAFWPAHYYSNGSFFNDITIKMVRFSCQCNSRRKYENGSFLA